MTCSECGELIEPGRGPYYVWLKGGWEPQGRGEGGGNRVALADRTTTFAHKKCIDVIVARGKLSKGT
jgi:hypothetical protein